MVDSTVTPGISWQDSPHVLLDGPDYRGVSREPQSLSEVFGGPPDESGPLEIPVGAAWFPPWAEACSRTEFLRKRLGTLTS
jgi:hypothetical protein